MKTKTGARIIFTGMIVAVIAFFAVFAANQSTAYASDSIVYNAADFSNLTGRTKQDVMKKYTEAEKHGTTYIYSDKTSYYETSASLNAPYSYGVLSKDTLKAMKGMTDFYRWLSGVNDIAVNTECDASLQAQALDRNFQFDHYISNDSKPSDMDDELWNEGFECKHNILAAGYTPTGAITGWMNEGYNLNKSTWDTVGHRTSLLSAGYKNISFGYCGRVAIGKCGSWGNDFSNTFAAFPAAGYVPSKLISKSNASWTVQLKTDKVKAKDASAVEITVKNLNTGSRYTCNTSNSKAKISTSFLNFVQPSDAEGSYYSDPYKVTVTGLYDVTTGKDASITYTVNFFDPPTVRSISLSQAKYAYTGKEIKPDAVVKGTDDKTLTEGKDYTVSYYNNKDEGTGIVEVSGIGNYCGVSKKTFKIEEDRKDISQTSISFSNSSYYRYTGKAVTPEVKVESFGKILKAGKDYQVSYSDNINAGTAGLVVKGIGEYSGSAKKTFTIGKANQNLKMSISSNPIEVGGTAKITASGKESPEIEFKSSDESVATVDEDGTVHALKAGKADFTITAKETDNYLAATRSISVTTSSDTHNMVETNVICADKTNNRATVTRKCSVCGKTETKSFTTMDDFDVWYWTGYNGSTEIDSVQSIDDEHSVELRRNTPSDAEDTTLALKSSDTNVMTVNDLSFKFVGTGKVTLIIYAKYRPSVMIKKTFNVTSPDEKEKINDLEDEMEDAISDAEEVGNIGYTDSSWDAFLEAIDDAENVYYDENHTYDELKAALEKLNSARSALSTKPVVTGTVKKGMTYKVSGQSYKVNEAATGHAKGIVTLVKSKNAKSVTVPAAVRLKDGKTYKVETVNAKSFTGSKIRTVTIGKNVKKLGKYSFRTSKATKIILKTKLLKKSSVEGSLKGSKVKTVLVKVGSKKQNKTYAKRYKKIFTKKNCGEKAAVK